MSDSISYKNALPLGYQLQEYRILSVLGQGGFGITYLAEDVQLHQRVAIKEYFPNEFAYREATKSVQAKSTQDRENFAWGLQRFMEEGRALAKFSHPNIVRVLRYFEQHETAYMVMEYEQGRSLKECNGLIILKRNIANKSW